ncbi:MAG: hypothetical protein GEU88_05275 [Solirubrobacterales bacterium]|nr:hypothetical protein [Solirubrobacterales bacterium]
MLTVMPKRYGEDERLRLAQLLEGQGLTLREAARRVGVSASTAWRWQSQGRQAANREQAAAWARRHRARVVARQRDYRRRLAESGHSERRPSWRRH